MISSLFRMFLLVTKMFVFKAWITVLLVKFIVLFL